MEPQGPGRDWAALTEETVAPWYAGDLERGRAACDRLLGSADIPSSAGYRIGQNATHYAQPLGDLLPGWEAGALGPVAGEGWHDLPPAFALGPDGRLAIVVGARDFAAFPPRRWDVADGDAAGFLRAAFSLDPPTGAAGAPAGLAFEPPAGERPWSRVPDLASLLPFRLGDGLFALGRMWVETPAGPAGRAVLVDLDLDAGAGALSRPRWVAAGRDLGDVVPAASDDGLVLLRLGPAPAAFRCDPVTGDVEPFPLPPVPRLAARFSLETPLAPGDGGWLAIARQDVPVTATRSVTLHRLLGFDAELRLRSASHPFRFTGGEVEAAAGIAMLGDLLFLGFVADGEPGGLGFAPLDEALGLLRPLDASDPIPPSPGFDRGWAPPRLIDPRRIEAREELDALVAGIDLDDVAREWSRMAALDASIAPLQEAVASAVSVAREVVFGRPPDAPELSIVVPLYLNLDFLDPQLAALAADPGLRAAELIYVLDDPDREDRAVVLLDDLHARHGFPFRLLALDDNGGYSRANNLGAAAARAPLLLLLNSDAWPIAPGWLGRVRAFMAGHPEAAAIGTKVLYPDGTINGAGSAPYWRANPGCWDWRSDEIGLPRDDPRAGTARRMPGLGAAAMLVTMDAWRRIGGFSERYVAGQLEDCDLFCRLGSAGLEQWYLPEAEFLHLEQRSYAGAIRHRHWLYNAWVHQQRWDAYLRGLASR